MTEYVCSRKYVASTKGTYFSLRDLWSVFEPSVIAVTTISGDHLG